MTYHLRMHRGGQARPVRGAEARKRIRQELHSLAITVQGNHTIGDLAAVAPEGTGVNVVAWWKDVRRGQQTVYGTLFRFIDIAVRLGTPRSVLLVIPDVIRAYITDQYEDDRLAPPTLRRVA